MYRVSALARLWRGRVDAMYVARVHPDREELRLETHGPLGTIWVGIGLIAFYIALTWVNLLLGHFLTPLFIIPLTWVMDAWEARKADKEPDKTTVGA
jgi:hypothetical protein